MVVRYTCPYWGQEGTSASVFLQRAVAEGYDGVEINFPNDDVFVREFQSALNTIRSGKTDFVFIAQHVLEQASETVGDHIARATQRLEYLVSLKPDFINIHTGKDYFSFDDNCRVIEAVEQVAARGGVPLMHETHRSRFTFHAASLLQYLQKFPNLKLTGDFSHWCTVSESLLGDQQHIIEKIIPNVQHIHARIGYEQSPQVNDPFAPEWAGHVETFVRWWKQIISARLRAGQTSITITPEFGPVPYMPTLPYSQKPVADQWNINSSMKTMLKRRLNDNSI